MGTEPTARTADVIKSAALRRGRPAAGPTVASKYESMATAIAASYIRLMGEDPERIHLTGCPSSTLFGDGTAGRQIAEILARVEDFEIQKKLSYD